MDCLGEDKMDLVGLVSIPGSDLLFVISALLFNLFIIGVYIAQKLVRTSLVRKFGIALLCLTVPFLVVFISYLIMGKPTWQYLVFLAIFVYMFLEWLWDYRMKIDFRTQPKLHIPYIILFYIVLFGNIRIAFTISPAWGWIISVSFWLLLAALIVTLIPVRRQNKD
jgi:hypothetical protein